MFNIQGRFLLGLIIAVLVSIVLIFNVQNIKDIFESQDQDCKILFDITNEISTDFDMMKFEKLFAQKCKTKVFNITKNDISKIIKETNNCFDNINPKIFGSTFFDKSICIYCSNFLIEDEIENFDTLLLENLDDSVFENKLFNNLNKELLKKENLPQKLKKESSLGLFYLIHRENEISLNLIGKTLELDIFFEDKKQISNTFGGVFLKEIELNDASSLKCDRVLIG